MSLAPILPNMRLHIVNLAKDYPGPRIINLKACYLGAYRRSEALCIQFNKGRSNYLFAAVILKIASWQTG